MLPVARARRGAREASCWRSYHGPNVRLDHPAAPWCHSLTQKRRHRQQQHQGAHGCPCTTQRWLPLNASCCQAFLIAPISGARECLGDAGGRGKILGGGCQGATSSWGSVSNHGSELGERQFPSSNYPAAHVNLGSAGRLLPVQGSERGRRLRRRRRQRRSIVA